MDVMLSAIPAISFSDGSFGNPFPPFETAWGFQEPFLPFQNQEPAFFPNSGLENSNPKPVSSDSGSDELNRTMNNFSPGSDDPNPSLSPTTSNIDERKLRRMISNRESARRSRMRKQKHLENLRNQANRLRVGNRDLMNRLRLVTHHSQLIRAENNRLESESALLRQKLWAVRQVLLVRELQQFTPSACATAATIHDANHPPPSSIASVVAVTAFVHRLSASVVIAVVHASVVVHRLRHSPPSPPSFDLFGVEGVVETDLVRGIFGVGETRFPLGGGDGDENGDGDRFPVGDRGRGRGDFHNQ
ncbi:hypothetical protein HYC85_005613 [Camellia sinensis]|uniref:BZIP domain-containing protein n=1 Tax=Camellia sinensis TaxID=4442 RepID=A0A7J7I2N0_CAMSI|nr:hypothetical protein HYC85_005613 [Camellia sinensis]